MFDMHYDLLTKIRMCSLDNSDFLDKWLEYYNDNNVKGLIANLCFESIDEMKEEYNLNYYNKADSVTNIFSYCVDECRKRLPQNIECYFGIEGADYIEDEKELCTLYDLGLRCINIVWNEPNKYGSGIRGEYGLTESGLRFVEKCFELHIGIDLSHANEKTFYDIISLAKENANLSPIIYASHSNSRNLCDVKRNLTDEQLEALKSVNGFVGVFSHRNFVIKNAFKEKIDEETLRKRYIDHIEHIGNIVGFDHVMLSTDDMKFSFGDQDYQYLPIYDYETIKDEIEKDLSKRFSAEIVNRIMIGNSKRLLSMLSNSNEKDLNAMRISLTK